MSVSVAAVRDANIACVYVCTWLSSEIAAFTLWCVTPDYGYIAHLISDYCFLSFPPPPSAPPPPARAPQICVMRARACDRQASAEVRRLMTAARPLMTPSILSTPAHTDYPQRHLLTLYANEQREGVMRKEWQIKKKRKKKKEKRGWKEKQKERHRKQSMKEYVRGRGTWNKALERVWHRGK